jgi:aspartate/methionine/tyrosine aminotransferase
MIRKADRLNDVKEYYFSTKLREVGALKQAGKPIINMAIGSPDLQPPDEVVNALKKAMDLPNVHQYQGYKGIPELRESMARFYYGQYGVSLDPESEVLPLMGSKEGILHISMAFLNKGDGVLVPNPGYPTYSAVTKLLEAEPFLYDLTAENNWFPDLTSLTRHDLSKIKLMWVNYPHMPTGAVANRDKLNSLIDFANKHKIIVVNDNPCSCILNENQNSILSISGSENVALELNSLSKTFNMAGWRVGMVMGNATMLSTILQVKSNMDSGMFLGVQIGAVKALQMKNDWFKKLNTVYKKRRSLVWNILDELQCSYDTTTSGLFVWAKLPQGKNAESFTDKLLYEKDVFIAPGTVFGSNGEGYLRASLCVGENELLEVLNRVKTKENN